MNITEVTITTSSIKGTTQINTIILLPVLLLLEMLKNKIDFCQINNRSIITFNRGISLAKADNNINKNSILVLVKGQTRMHTMNFKKKVIMKMFSRSPNKNNMKNTFKQSVRQSNLNNMIFTSQVQSTARNSSSLIIYLRVREGILNLCKCIETFFSRILDLILKSEESEGLWMTLMIMVKR